MSENRSMWSNVIDNVARPSSSGATLPVIDPSDGQPFGTIPRSTASDIDAAVGAARWCFDGTWNRMPAVERGRCLEIGRAHV